MEASEPRVGATKRRRSSVHFLLCLLGFAIAAGSLLIRWLGLPSSAELLLLGLGHLTFGTAATAAMLGVARDGWATAHAAKRAWWAFAVSITALMVLTATWEILFGLLDLAPWLLED